MVILEQNLFVPKLGGMCLHQNLEGKSQGPRSSQNHIIKGSVVGRSETTDSDAQTEIDFLRTALADNDRGYARHQDENVLDSTKRERLESKLS